MLWFLIILVVATMAYVRLAPSDPARWHVEPRVTENRTLKNGALRIVDGFGAQALARFDAVAMATPRTTVLAGSVDAGMVTYVTRSKIMGYPDYTTAKQDGDDLLVFGRSRFGKSDLGVNTARLRSWIAAALS